jgi:hypothetical protein
MLAVDYRKKLDQLIHSMNWKIEIPDEWAGYFEDTGRPTAFADDQRHNQRLKIRTCGVLWFEKAIPIRSRTKEPMGIYTRDFSRQGTGFLSSCEIYPEEHVRIVLPTFWVQLKVARARRLNAKCYEIGAVLSRQHEPDSDAFVSGSHLVGV